MLTDQKKQKIDDILADFSREELLFGLGYLSAFLQGKSEVRKGLEVSILYISETGNAKFLALEIAKILKKQGAKVKAKSIGGYDFSQISRQKNLVLLTSTHGEGEIPEVGQGFAEFLRAGVDLSAVNYLVVGLGDRNYPLFCQAGRDFDVILGQNGAKKVAEVVELDLDFADFAQDVAKNVAEAFAGEEITPSAKKKSAVGGNFVGKVLANVNLNDEGSVSQTHHIEIGFEGDLGYEPGDAIGILLDGKDLGVEGKLTPRLYSIASAMDENEGSVHILVKFLRYKNDEGQEIEGLFSSYLARLGKGDSVRFYLSKNRNFKLPDGDRDIIMIGAGTGVAPFRAFLQQRDFDGDEGRNWLFFGERNFRTDFLYQAEWQDYLAAGLLTKIDVAFSRDQEEKIYVQDRILQNSEEFKKWVENGAYVFICGDKEGMAKGVEASIVEVLGASGFDKLKEENRLLLDVY